MSDTKRKDRYSEDDYFRAQVRKAADPSALARSALDVDELVAGMAELAAQYPDWREHIPYDVAMNFKASEAHHAQYGGHLDSCELCQGLIETFNPPERLRVEILAAIQDQVAEPDSAATTTSPGATIHEAIEALVRQLFGPGRRPVPIPVPAGIVAGLGNLYQPAFLAMLNSAEHSDNPLDRFGAAELYLKFSRPELAYMALGKGLEMCGLEHTIAERICNAPSIREPSSAYLLGVAEELYASSEDPRGSLVAVEMNAKLGDHLAAINEIGRLVVDQRIQWDAASAADTSVQVPL